MIGGADVRVKRAAEARGRLAETLCVMSLRLRGWRILARRLKTKRGMGVGEVDIVARRGRTIAFIEVKTRATVAAALESVTPHQQHRIARAAAMFISALPAHPDTYETRFDVMIVKGLVPIHVRDAWRP